MVRKVIRLWCSGELNLFRCRDFCQFFNNLETTLVLPVPRTILVSRTNIAVDLLKLLLFDPRQENAWAGIRAILQKGG